MNKDFPGHGASKPCSNSEWATSLGLLLLLLSEAELYKTGLLSVPFLRKGVYMLQN